MTEIKEVSPEEANVNNNNSNEEFPNKFELTVPITELQKKSIFLATPMYGGVCAGMYTRSIIALSETCQKYGVKLQLYFMFNESLITRARNYCADEFMRSGCTHLMFIDSDIGFNPQDVMTLLALQTDESPYDVIGGPYPKKCFPYNAKIMTEDGEKTIKWIVENQYKGKALSINENGKFVYNNITHWYKTQDGHKKAWSKIVTRGTNRSNFIVTSDHEILVFDDPLNPKPYLLEASKANGKYTIDIPNKRASRLFNKEQLSILYGIVMGDGTIGKNNKISTRHSLKQEEYLDYIKNIIGGSKQYVEKGSGYSLNPSVALNIPGTIQTNKLRELIYSNGKKSPLSLINLIDDISLAFWYMDDGCLKKSGDNNYYCELNTQGFSDEEQIALVNMFNERFGLYPVIDDHWTTAEGKTFKRLRFRNEDSKKFFELIHKYICPSMEYKLSPEFRGLEKHSFDNNYLDFSSSYIEDVIEVEPFEYTYDITVEDTHKVFVSGHAATQCISWEKVYAAVNKGFADENPNALENFVGDYVFNPKMNGKASIPINKPVEVMEIGTGFMMIRRKTLEDYAKAFTELSYRPDHVRTEHFDGSREIMAYFDTVIDPTTKRYLSEDYMFCYNVQKMGGQVWLCPWMQLQHVGNYTFGGSLAALAAVGASPTADPGEMQRIKNAQKKK